MKETTETFYCDRCGRVIDKQKRGSFIGTYSEIVKRLGRPVEHKAGHVHICIAGKDGRTLDLCDKCNESLAEWFNKPIEIGEQCQQRT